jgi:hypothetical protein
VVPKARETDLISAHLSRLAAFRMGPPKGFKVSHNPEVVGSNPTPATGGPEGRKSNGPFFMREARNPIAVWAVEGVGGGPATG